MNTNKTDTPIPLKETHDANGNLCPLCRTRGILSGPGLITQSGVQLTFKCPDCGAVFQLMRARVRAAVSVVQYLSDGECPDPRLLPAGR
jgi:uncharacterized Zn finger protein